MATDPENFIELAAFGHTQSPCLRAPCHYLITLTAGPVIFEIVPLVLSVGGDGGVQEGQPVVSAPAARGSR